VVGSPSNPKRYTIATSSTNSFSVGMLDKFMIDTSQFQNDYPLGWTLDIGNSGGSLDLVYIPEPGTVGLLGLSSACLILRRRRA
jgi:hypothetical protein